ncbi:hypothetical protein [Pedobacter sp. SYP-B3415]|uniref:hypothetical protein n=1 Tax=Pedobacter sp. SYP-B3415 TaxID=2496641 RepID=UPI0013EA1C95|nr:hypothetical protein [Pedobacter sp. SYP-B3415]
MRNTFYLVNSTNCYLDKAHDGTAFDPGKKYLPNVAWKRFGDDDRGRTRTIVP